MKPGPGACQEACKSNLRLKLKTIVGDSKDAVLYYELTGRNGSDYMIFQHETNPSRTRMTKWGPGSFGPQPNAFPDHIAINPFGEASGNDSSQTFWAFSAAKLPNGKTVPREPYFPIVVQDLDGNDFCSLSVWQGNDGSRVNGNLITESLRSFLPSR